jgi:glycosyltransferase involved in cell wall biosynthesis
MNILIISNLVPFEIGGAENQASLLAKEFYYAGHNVTVAGHRIPTKQSDQIKTFHIFTFTCNKITRGISYFISLTWFFLFHYNQFDVVYCRFVGEACVILSFIKRFFNIKIPLICTSECSGTKGDASFIHKLPWSNFWISCINHSCDKINIISPIIEKEFIKIGIFSDLFTYVPNGTYIFNQKKSLPTKPRKLIFVGRFVEQKGLDLLLLALSQLSKNNQSFSLTLVGDGPERPKIEKLAIKLNIMDSINFTGQIPHENIPNLLQKHDIFVLPSRYEGFGVAVIEAMSVGLPCLVTRCGGPEFIVSQETGRVCNANNIETLKLALLELISLPDEQLIKIGNDARHVILNHYNIQNIAYKYISIFESIITKNDNFIQ